MYKIVQDKYFNDISEKIMYISDLSDKLNYFRDLSEKLPKLWIGNFNVSDTSLEHLVCGCSWLDIQLISVVADR